jgi:hypothetical protein
MSPDFSENKFEKLHQKLTKRLRDLRPRIWRRLRQFVVLTVSAFILMEIVAVNLVIDELAIYGVPADIARHHFYLTRYTVNLFLDTPTINKFERSTNTRYIGFNQTGCNDYIPDALLGWRNQPGISCAFLAMSGGKPDGESLIWNAYGSDGFVPSDKSLPRYELEKPKGVLRIIMLGGSAMVGFGSSPFESIPAHAQRILNFDQGAKPPGVRYEVINAGVGAYNSAQESLYLMSELVYYQPDIVVFFNGGVDSMNGHGHFSDAIDAHHRNAKKFSSVPFSSTRFKRHRDFSKQIAQSYGLAGAAKILKAALSQTLGGIWLHTGTRYLGWKYQFRKNWKRFWKGVFGVFKSKKIKKRVSRVDAIKDDYDLRTLKVYEENIRRSVSLAQLHGFNVLVALQPLIGVDGKTYAPGREQNYANTDIGKAKIMRRQRFYKEAGQMLATLNNEYAGRKNICFANMSKIFKNVMETLYVDMGHFNSRGNGKSAQAIIKRLTECGFLPSPSTEQ